jgi:succinate dehydrogenase/fumarate reductase flavoprotein subunit
VLATEATGRVTVPAAAVVLATGGYDQDPLLRARHLPPAITASASAPGNVGDALRICGRLGVSLQNLGQGWWMPMVSIPAIEPGEAPGWHALIRERGLPRVIIVDRGGRRFANEAAPYHELGRVLIRAAGTAPATRPPAYLIFDEGYRTRYSVPGAGPLPAAPGWLARAATVTGLAAVLGIDPAGLGDQVTRWNAACAAGTDREFGRGRSAYDRYYGDPDQAGNPSLGPLGQPPYYGMPVHAGTIGSKGGPVTDPDGRILGPAGAPIPGIYAAGNSAASWTADGYPGPGATLGFGMTLGYRAACAIIRAARPVAAG